MCMQDALAVVGTVHEHVHPFGPDLLRRTAMSATLSVPMAEAASPRAPLLTALVYPQNKYPAPAFEALVACCRSRGVSLAGVLQHAAL